MDDLYFKLLNALIKAGINNVIDVTSLFDIKKNDEYESEEWQYANTYLRNMALFGHILYPFEDFPTYSNSIYGDLYAAITDKGYKFYNAEQKRISDEIMSKALLKNTELTTVYTQMSFKTSQLQMVILISTLFISMISVLVSFLSYKASTQSKTIEQHYLIVEPKKHITNKGKAISTDTIMLKGHKDVSLR